MMFVKLRLSITLGILDDLLEGVRGEANTISLEEFVLELNPVQTESMQETFQDIHHQQDTKGDSSKHSKSNVGGKPVHVQSGKHGLLPKHSGKLRVSKGKGPKTEVRGSVGDHTKNKLNGLNGLVDDNLTKSMFIVMVFTMYGLFFSVVLNGCMLLLAEQVGLGQEQNRD